MRSLLLPLFLFCHIISIAQSLSGAYDSLRKYNYLIIGFFRLGNQISYSNGTGFFIKQNGKLFFVTASHVLNGCDPKGIKEPHPDMMSILLKLKNGDLHFINFDVRVIKDTSSCPIRTITPDLFTLEVNDTFAIKNAWSIENFIWPRFEHYKNAIIIGFDSSTINKLNRNKLTVVPPPTYISFLDKTYYIDQPFVDSARRDTSNYYIFPNSDRIDSNLGGYSGAPIFLQDSLSHKWRIMSILNGSGKDTNNKPYLYGATIDCILGDINAKLLKNPISGSH